MNDTNDLSKKGAAENAKPERDNEKKKPSPLDEALDWIESFVFAIFIVLLVFIFLFRTVVVDGSSMNPTHALQLHARARRYNSCEQPSAQ